MEASKFCHICDRQLDLPNDPTTLDCGGDCLQCMADVGDPDCELLMKQISKGENMDINKAWYDENKAWYDEEETGPIEVPEFEKLLNEMFEQNQKIKLIKSDLKDEQGILTKMKFKVLAYFEEFGKTKHLAQHCTVYIKTSFTCKTPKTPEEKAALFAWMKEKEIYDQYATVNSKSLNSLYNSLVKEDSDFVMPGTSDPGYFQTVEMRST